MDKSKPKKLGLFKDKKVLNCQREETLKFLKNDLINLLMETFYFKLRYLCSSIKKQVTFLNCTKDFSVQFSSIITTQPESWLAKKERIDATDWEILYGMWFDVSIWLRGRKKSP